MAEFALPQLLVLAMIALAVGVPGAIFLRHRRAERETGEDPGRRETRRIVLRLLANGDEAGLAERRPILLAAIDDALSGGLPRLDPARVPTCADLVWRLASAYRRSGGGELSHRDVATLYVLATAPQAAEAVEDLVRLNPQHPAAGVGEAMFRHALAA